MRMHHDYKKDHQDTYASQAKIEEQLFKEDLRHEKVLENRHEIEIVDR